MKETVHTDERYSPQSNAEFSAYAAEGGMKSTSDAANGGALSTALPS